MIFTYKYSQGINWCNKFLTSSCCHLDLIQEFSHFGRKVSDKIGKSRLILANLGQYQLELA